MADFPFPKVGYVNSLEGIQTRESQLPHNDPGGRFGWFFSHQEDFNMIFGARAKFSRYIGGIS